MAGRGPQFLSLISVGSAMEIFFGIFVVGVIELGIGTGAALVAGSLERRNFP